MSPPTPERQRQTELAGLPAWLYPAGFWVAVALLAAGVLWPDLAALGVVCVGAVPVLAAVWVALTSWSRDRRLAWAAVCALAGLALVVGVRGLLQP